MNKEDIKNYMIKLVITMLLILIVLNFSAVLSYIGTFINILSPIIYGGCIAYLLVPICNKLQSLLDKFKIKHSLMISIAISETIFMILLIIVCIIILPQSIRSIQDIVIKLPSTLDSLVNIINEILGSSNITKNMVNNNLENAITNYIENDVIKNIDRITIGIIDYATSIGKWVFDFIMGVALSIFALNCRKELATGFNKIIKVIFGDTVAKFIISEAIIANKMFSGFISGKVIDSTIVGVLCFIALVLLDIPYAGLVSIIVGITNIIPVVGPFIGAIPGAIIIFSSSPKHALYFIIFIIILQQIDGNIIGPKCIGNSTGLNTFWVTIAIVVFGGLWGITGMIIGVPLLAVLFDLFNKIIDEKLYRDKQSNK